nr:carboxypeptidase-like regulatory domain-containing protein [Flavobacterium sp.]
MKKLSLLFFLVTTLATAQTIRFEGIIQDNTKAPLEMANIMAMNQGTKAMDAYAITNDKGKFVLNLKPNATYLIKLSYLGMKNKEITVTTLTENITQNITMESGGIELDGVEIVREMPVSIKGDTIVYNADSFKTGTERKLEDVLKKLPGVEVNADGEVEVEGKKVTKLMVEGKDFFDGDTKLGVKNIPADAIDKVQVLRNYNENSILKGVENNQDNVAMNIKLKSGKKNFWFGDVTAAGGFRPESKFDRYNINPKLFYYSPKYSVNIITNFNNIGELPLTIQDYFKFTGGFRNMMSKGGSSFNVSSNDLGISLLRNNRAKEIETDFGATNFSYNPTKSWTISGFAILSSSITDLETVSSTNFLDPT